MCGVDKSVDSANKDDVECVCCVV